MIRMRVIIKKDKEICRERVNWIMEKKKKVTQIMNLKGNGDKKENRREN